jgi:cardiolipin synthase (CMP-forming)
MKKSELWTIPNLISAYRLFIDPLILYFIIAGKENLFAIFLVINLFTDALDGYIARKYHAETELGARLDAFADNFTYVLAFTGMLVFKMEDFRPHLVSFIIFVSMLVSTVVVSLIKFRKFPSYHLYTTKISGYIQAFFFICLFTVGFIPAFYYFVIAWGIMGAVECIVLDMILPEMRSNVKGLYWVLKERKTEKKKLP